MIFPQWFMNVAAVLVALAGMGAMVLLVLCIWYGVALSRSLRRKLAAESAFSADQAKAAMDELTERHADFERRYEEIGETIRRGARMGDRRFNLN